jgi:hypothetical protein
LSEAALEKNRLYESRIGELSILLEAAEVELAQAKDSLLNLRDLVPRVKTEAYRQGFQTGRIGFGVFVGYDPFNNNPTAGVGIYYGF